MTLPWDAKSTSSAFFSPQPPPTFIRLKKCSSQVKPCPRSLCPLLTPEPSIITYTLIPQRIPGCLDSQTCILSGLPSLSTWTALTRTSVSNAGP